MKNLFSKFLLNKYMILDILEQMYISTLEGQKFIEEALRMREFNHANVLRLIGVSIDRKEKDMPLVVLPFMKHGDLVTYIRDDTNVSMAIL